VSKKQIVKDVLSLVFRVGLSALLLIYLFNQMDIEKTKAVLISCDLKILALAAFIFFLLNLLVLFRWGVFIRGLDLNCRRQDVVKFFFMGLFGNLFLPSSIGGDIIKILGLCKNSEQKSRVVASVLMDRLSGFAGIIIVAFITFIFASRLINDPSVILSILALAIISVLIVLVLFNERIYSWGCRIFSRFPRLKDGLMTMHYDLAMLKGRQRYGYAAIALSCLAQIILAVVWYLISVSMNQSVDFIYFVLFVPLTCVASAMPSIGGLGTREAGAAYLFTKVGMDAGVAVSISLVNFFFMAMVGLIGGVIYVTTLSSGRVQHHSPDAGANPERI